MKTYYCKICVKFKKSFTGTRPMVRKHLQENHGIKSMHKRYANNRDYHSPITAEMGSY